MKQWKTIETKHGVVIHYEDPDSFKRETFHCTYQEAWGLLHSLERLRDSPAFREREPRPRTYHVSDRTNGRQVTTRIEYTSDE